MMRTLFGRELERMTAQPAFAAAIVCHILALILFVVGWGDGTGVRPLLPRTVYVQLRLVQLAVCGILLPWTAARCMAEERGNDVVWLCSRAAVRPSRLFAMRIAAVSVGLGLVAVAGAPVAIAAARMSMTPGPAVIKDELVLLGVALLAAATSLLWRYLCAGRLAGWAAATMTTGVLMVAIGSFSGSSETAAAAFAVLGAGVAWLLVARADTALLYLSENGA